MTISIRHDHYFHIDGDDARALTAIIHQLAHIEQKLDTNMAAQAEIIAKLNETLVEVKTNTDLIAGLDTLIQGLADQLAQALKDAGASPAVLAAAAEVMTAVAAQKAAIVAAANVNTPQETPEDVAVAASIK